MAKSKTKSDVTETKVLDHTAALVKRVWGFCNVLRDDGVGASEYLEQLTFLLFLKMVDEQDLKMPSEWNWQKLRTKSGSELKDYYEKLLDALSKKPGMLGQMFYQAKNNINTPARLAEIIKMIDDEVWTGLAVDLKGNLYEDILAKTAEDIKSGAGQYFTPRALISAIMNCLRPKPGEKFKDPATGTGGFFLKAHDYVIDHYADKMNVEQKRFLKFETFSGNDIVPRTRRMCLMNMYLHGMGSLDGAVPVDIADSLLRSPTELVDIVGTNPPFGKKTSKVDIDDEGNETKERQVYNRSDFCCETSNKQLNFLQHILTMLKPTGRAAVVLPDPVLTEKNAGEIIRRKLLEITELHTILRLPTGIFYKPGVKANVLFFDARPASRTAQTKEVWVYDYRTNVHHTLKSNPMKESDLAEFVKLYCADNRGKRKETWDAEKNPEGRWRKFTYEEILKRPAANLNFKWLKDKEFTVEEFSFKGVKSAIKGAVSRLFDAYGNFERQTAQIGDTSGDRDEDLQSLDLTTLSNFAERKIIDLAIRGKLTKREKGDEPAAALLARIAAEKQKLIDAKMLRKLDAYDPISDGEIPFDELPSGWSWCRFGEVVDYVQPTEYIVRDTNYDDSYTTPVLTAGQSFVLGYTNEKDHHFKASKERPVIIFDDFTTSTQWVDFEFKVKSSAMKILVPYKGCDICMRYIFMAIRNNPFRPSTHARHWIDKYAKFVLPLPPLAEQKRIVARVDELLAECRKMRGE